MDTQRHLEDIKYDETFIKNLSGTDIPEDVMTILSLGPKFAIAPTDESILEVATDVEAVISRSNTESQQEVMCCTP